MAKEQRYSEAAREGKFVFPPDRIMMNGTFPLERVRRGARPQTVLRCSTWPRTSERLRN